MNYFKQIKIASLLEAICAIVFGVLFIACPDFTKQTIMYFFSILLIVMGLSQIFNYFGYGIEPLGFIKGVVNMALGIVFFANSQMVSDANIFAFVFGVI